MKTGELLKYVNFMKVKMFIVPVVAAILACGCQTGKEGGEVRAALNAIYSEVIGEYNAGKEEKNYEKRFCSKEYNEIYAQTLKKDDALAEQGCIGFFDADHWLNAQDWGNVSYSIRGVKLISQDKARAKVVIKNLGQCQEVEIGLVKEEGKWKIDDLGDRERMREYLRENR